MRGAGSYRTLTNALNALDRGAMLRALYDAPALAGLWRITAWGYDSAAPLHTAADIDDPLLSRNGVRQGDPLGALLFAVALRPVLHRAATAHGAGTSCRGRVFSFLDNVNIEGPPEQLPAMVDNLVVGGAAIGLFLVPRKCETLWFHPTRAVPAALTAAFGPAGRGFALVTDATVLLGAPIGCDDARVSALCEDIARAHAPLWATLRRADVTVQEAWALLRVSMAPRLGFLVRCVRPDRVAAAARAFDAALAAVALERAGMLVAGAVPASGEGLAERLAADPPVEVALSIIRSPLALGGCGLRSALATSPLAFLASAAAALPLLQLRHFFPLPPASPLR